MLIIQGLQIVGEVVLIVAVITFTGVHLGHCRWERQQIREHDRQMKLLS